MKNPRSTWKHCSEHNTVTHVPTGACWRIDFYPAAFSADSVNVEDFFPILIERPGRDVLSLPHNAPAIATAIHVEWLKHSLEVDNTGEALDSVA